MTRTFMPKSHYLAVGGRYRPMFRYYKESPWRLVPGAEPCATAGQAISAADAYIEQKLNPPIRCDRAEQNTDPLGLEAWHRERAALAAEMQEATLGAIIVRGRSVKIERRRA